VKIEDTGYMVLVVLILLVIFIFSQILGDRV